MPLSSRFLYGYTSLLPPFRPARIPYKYCLSLLSLMLKELTLVNVLYSSFFVVTHGVVARQHGIIINMSRSNVLIAGSSRYVHLWAIFILIRGFGGLDESYEVDSTHCIIINLCLPLLSYGGEGTMFLWWVCCFWMLLAIISLSSTFL